MSTIRGKFSVFCESLLRMYFVQSPRACFTGSRYSHITARVGLGFIVTENAASLECHKMLQCPVFLCNNLVLCFENLGFTLYVLKPIAWGFICICLEGLSRFGNKFEFQKPKPNCNTSLPAWSLSLPHFLFDRFGWISFVVANSLWGLPNHSLGFKLRLRFEMYDPWTRKSCLQLDMYL